MNQERFSRAFSFLLHNGTEVYPVMMKNRVSGKIAFRITVGGTGGNTLEAGEEVAESVMIAKVLTEGHAVRCKPLSRGTASLYKVGHHSVKEVKRHTATATRAPQSQS